MKSNIMTFINEIEGYKTAIKNLHWSAKNMSAHKLFDDIASSVSDIQDMVSEIAQGLYGRIKPNELKPQSYNINNEKQFLADLLETSKKFYKTLDGDDYIGLRSEIETFIGKISQFEYLLDLCLKEDFKRNFKKSLTEKKRYVKLTENELETYLTECVQKALNKIKNNNNIF